LPVDPRRYVRWGALSALVLATAVVAPIALWRHPATQPENGSTAAQNAPKSAAESLSELLGMRSPGERERGVLAATKQRRFAVLSPHQRALRNGMRPPRERALGKIINPEALGPLGAIGGDSAVSAPGVSTEAAPPLGIVGSGPGGASTPGSAPPLGTVIVGGPGGVPVPTIPPVIVPPPGLPAVPEPATWISMLLGFLTIGCISRVRPVAVSFRRAN